MNVVFDLGNVVNRWEPARAVGHLFESEHAMQTELDRIGFLAWNLEQDRGRSFEDAIKDAPDCGAREVFRAYCENVAAAHSQPIEGTVAIMNDLRERHVPLYAITNAARESVVSLRAQHEWMQHFLDVVVSGEEGVLKPDPAIFAALCNRNELAPADCLFIDDTAVNADGARTFGMDAIHFTNPDALRDELHKRGLL